MAPWSAFTLDWSEHLSPHIYSGLAFDPQTRNTLSYLTFRSWCVHQKCFLSDVSLSQTVKICEQAETFTRVYNRVLMWPLISNVWQTLRSHRGNASIFKAPVLCIKRLRKTAVDGQGRSTWAHARTHTHAHRRTLRVWARSTHMTTAGRTSKGETSRNSHQPLGNRRFFQPIIL